MNAPTVITAALAIIAAVLMLTSNPPRCNHEAVLDGALLNCNRVAP